MKLLVQLKKVARPMMMLWLSIGVLGISRPAGATSPKTCNEVLQLCDKALQDQRKLNHENLILIKATEDLNHVQRDKIDILEAENKSLLRNPYIWGAIGFGLGVYLMKK